METISAINYIQTIKANLNNSKMNDNEFREFVKNTIDIVNLECSECKSYKQLYKIVSERLNIIEKIVKKRNDFDEVTIITN